MNGSEPTGILKLLEPKFRYLEVSVPYYDYLRGDVLVSDLEIVNEDISVDIGNIFSLVILQFLIVMRKGSELENVGRSLMNKKDLYLNGEEHHHQEELIMKSQNTWGLELVRTPKKVKPKMAFIKFRMKASEIYRCEILLHDITQVIPQFDLCIEELVAILYLDFIKQIKSNGNNHQVMEQIIDALLYYQEKQMI